MGAGNLNVWIAFAAGVVSFVSPCILPLIPSYLSLMGGTTLSTLTTVARMRRVAVRNTLFFIAGFTVVFVLLGAFFSATFSLFSSALLYINIAAGVVVIVLGLHFIFDFLKFLNIEKRLHLSRKPVGMVGSLLFGMAFGAGWTPCIGPILGSILLLAGSSASLPTGMLLLLVYAIGLGLPFVLTGVFLPEALRRFSSIKRHMLAIRITSGIFLIAVGYLILSGDLKAFNGFVFGLAGRLTGLQQAHAALVHSISGLVFLICAIGTGWFYVRWFARSVRVTRTPVPQEGVPVAFVSATQVESSTTGKDGSSQPADASGRQETVSGHLRPVRAAFTAAFLALSVLSFSGVMNWSRILAAWLGFQGM